MRRHRTRTVRIIALCALITAWALVAAGCTTARGATDGSTGRVLHVAPDGNNLFGDGTAEKPWATIDFAARLAMGGDTVQVAAGTYDERVTIPASASGSESTPTYVIADGPVVISRGMVVSASFVRVRGFEITPGAAGLQQRVGQVRVTGDGNMLSGLDVHDTQSGSGVSFDGGAARNLLVDFRIHRVPEFGIVMGTYGSGGSGYASATFDRVARGTVSETGGWSGIEISGADNIVDGVTISGGPSGWNTLSPGTSSSMPHPDGDGIRVQGPRATIRNCVIHDVWEWYDDTQHTDCVQFWTDSDGLLIENCILGTWQPGPPPSERGGLAQEIGPSQVIMAGTVPSGQRITFTVRNSLLLGECGSHTVITTTAEKNATLKAVLVNNTFWSSKPSVPARSVLRNNIFRSFYAYPTTLSLDSDYNLFSWVGGSGSNNVPWQEGKHSLGVTYAKRVDPAFVNPDITATGDWGLSADFRPKATSPAVGAASPLVAPATDLTGWPRGAKPDIGAYDDAARSTLPTAGPVPAF